MARDTLTSRPPPNRSRRHSSGAASLSIQTQNLSSMKRGPSTADVGGTGGMRYMESETAVKGTTRKHLKSILPSFKQKSSTAPAPPPAHPAHLPPRQSPNHLVIPYSAQHPPPAQTTQQYHSPSQQKQQHQHHSQKNHQQHRSPSPGRSPNSSRTTSPSGSGLLESLQDRTAMALMQRYLNQPDDPDSEMDISMQILISQAAVDAKGFEVLVPQTVESIKRHHATLSSRISALTARLSLESKIREAAQSLLTLHADNKKLARQAGEHLEAANRKVDQVATELWKLTQLAADLQRTLLQHTSGILALGVVRLEDQARREREMHALQIQQVAAEQDMEEQLESMSRTIHSLETDALEAQGLLEEKDRAIERLMKQLDLQQELFAKLDEQQQKTIALSQSQQKTLEALGSSDNDASKAVAQLSGFLSTVGKRLQTILQLQQQQQQQQQERQRRKQTSSEQNTPAGNTIELSNSGIVAREKIAQKWPSESTLVSSLTRQSQDSYTLTPPCVDSASSASSDGNLAGTVTAAVSERTILGSKGQLTGPGSSEQTLSSPHFSMDRISSIIDALENQVSESQQKMQVLEGELGLLRRHSVVLSESRNNTVRIKDTPHSSSMRSQAEDTIRAALEKSLKDALLEKEKARQELENERQRWQDDQNHRISALEKSLVAIEDSEKDASKVNTTGATGVNGGGVARSSSEGTIQALRTQLHEAIDEIDTLNQHQQSSLKSMRQLFDMIPDPRRKSHMQLFTAHQQLQQHIANITTGAGRNSPGRTSPSVYLSQISGRASPAGSVSSLSAGNAIGFSMEELIARVKELVERSQQLEQDNLELMQQLGELATRANPTISQSQPILPLTAAIPDTHAQQRQQSGTLLGTHEDQNQPPEQSTWILNSELERLQAGAGMLPLLEKELDLLKQHTDMLLDENARLAELAAAKSTGVSSSRGSTSKSGGMVRQLSRDDALDEMQEVVRVKDRLLRERDQLVQEQELALQRLRSDLDDVTSSLKSNDGALSSAPLSSFDLNELEEFRIKCGKLEEQVGEMSMVIAALESVSGGPGSGSQLLRALSSSTQTSAPSSWFSSGLGLSSAVGSLNFGSLTLRQQSQPEATPSGLSSPIPSSRELFYNQQQPNGNNESTRSQTPSSANSSSANLALGTGNSTAVAGATAALRKEFRRVMSELREEKEKAVRKEVEERRRLERTVRQLRRELQTVQSGAQA